MNSMGLDTVSDIVIEVSNGNKYGKFGNFPNLMMRLLENQYFLSGNSLLCTILGLVDQS